MGLVKKSIGKIKSTPTEKINNFGPCPSERDEDLSLKSDHDTKICTEVENEFKKNVLVS